MNPEHVGTVIAHLIVAGGVGLLYHFGYQATALGIAVYFLIPVTK